MRALSAHVDRVRIRSRMLKALVFGSVCARRPRCPLRLSLYSPVLSAGVRSYRQSSVVCSDDNRWHVRRRVGLPVVSSSLPAGHVNLEEVLENWRRHRKSPDFLTKYLYLSLKAASVQQLSPAQLMELPQFQSFWQHLSSQVPYMSANSAVMCLYNCAQYDFKMDTVCFSALISVCLQKARYIPPKAFGILLWSLYKLDLYEQSQPLVNRVVHCFHSGLLAGEHFKPQTFANVLWVLASTHTWPTYITGGVMEFVPQRVGDFDFHSLSIVLWAVTTAGLPPCDAFLKAAGDRAATLLQGQLPVISLVHCCWAFGSASYYHEPFFSVLKDRICAEPLQSPSLTPRLLSCVAWACARAGYYHADLLDRIAVAALNRIQHFNSQDLGNLAYCYGFLNHPSEELLIAISQIMSSQPKITSELACASVANACLIHGLYPEALLSQLMAYERVAALLEEGDGRHLHVCMNMHSLVKVERPDLQHCLLQPPQDRIVTALVLAKSMVHCKRVYSVFHSNICKALLQITGSTQHFTREALTTFSSFVDAELILNHEGKAVSIPSQWRGWSQPRKLLATAYSVEDNPMLWQVIDTVCSKQDVTILDTSLTEEVCVASDWAGSLANPRQCVARKVAIEADGPRHYAVNCRHKLGNTVLKHRLLKAHGWDVIAIPHFEWEHLVTDQDHINYLARRLYCTGIEI